MTCDAHHSLGNAIHPLPWPYEERTKIEGASVPPPLTCEGPAAGGRGEMLTPKKRWKLLQAWISNSLEIKSTVSPETREEFKEESQYGLLSCKLSSDKDKI